MSPFVTEVKPDWEGLLRCLRRQGAPRRVHAIELFLDPEVKEALATRFGIGEGWDQTAVEFPWRREIALQRFLGYDYVRCGVDAFAMPMPREAAADTAGLARSAGRSFVNHTRGPITSWEEFERYPWPGAFTTRGLEWYERNLPEDMCVIGSGGVCPFRGTPDLADGLRNALLRPL